MSVSKKRNRWMLPVAVVLILAVLAGAVFGYLVCRNEFTLELKLNGDAELEIVYGTEYVEAGAQCCYYGTIFQQTPLEIPVTVEGTVDSGKIGTYEINYYGEYEGISASEKRIVTVIDNVNPEIVLLGDSEVILPVGTEYQEQGCTAQDDYNGDLSDSVEISGTIDAETPGSYTLTYTVSDESGNSASTARTVTYVDVTPPELTLLGSEEMKVNTGTVFEDPGFKAEDDCDGDLSTAVSVTGNVDTGKPGSYTLTYSVEDAAGNGATVSRTVIVMDLTPPDLTLVGDTTVYLTIGNPFEDPGYSAEDAVDGDLTEQVVITDDINLYLPGTYTVNYSVTDSSGNAVQTSRTVVMTDITAKTPGGVIYLTYDDGPSGNTARLLDVLDRYGIKATFFVVNSGYGGTMARAASSGHTVAIHTASHMYDKIYASEEAYFEDLYLMQSIIQTHTGQTPMMLRFPGGSSNVTSSFNPGIMTRLTKLVEEKGFCYYDWNVDSRDAGEISGYAEASYNVIRGISQRSMSVVLMHDSYGYCVRATERVIEWGLANGYTFAVMTYGDPYCHHPVNN